MTNLNYEMAKCIKRVYRLHDVLTTEFPERDSAIVQFLEDGPEKDLIRYAMILMITEGTYWENWNDHFNMPATSTLVDIFENKFIIEDESFQNTLLETIELLDQKMSEVEGASDRF